MDGYNYKLLHYATAPRATAGRLSQYIDGNFVDYWAGKLRGKFVSLEGQWKFKTKAEALELARKYRQLCIDEAKNKGLLDQEHTP